MYRGIGSLGSYFEVTPNMYQPPPAANPGWQIAPVPGWGTNPDRSGPPMLAMNGERDIPVSSVLPRWTPVRKTFAPLGDTESDANQGYIALGIAGGIFFGWFLAWAYWHNKKKTKKA